MWMRSTSGLAQAYALSDDLGDGAEVFSLMRDSDLGPDDYLDAFFSTGDERENDVDPSQDFVGPTQ
jgi:pentatricopeptide repeat protein